jgi:hypothetical protein
MGDETRERHVYGRRKWSILDVAHTSSKAKLSDKKKDAKRTFMLPRKSGRRKQEMEACHGGAQKEHATTGGPTECRVLLMIGWQSRAIRERYRAPCLAGAVAAKTRSDNLDARAAGGSRDWARYAQP